MSYLFLLPIFSPATCSNPDWNFSKYDTLRTYNLFFSISFVICLYLFCFSFCLFKGKYQFGTNLGCIFFLSYHEFVSKNSSKTKILNFYNFHVLSFLLNIAPLPPSFSIMFLPSSLELRVLDEEGGNCNLSHPIVYSFLFLVFLFFYYIFFFFLTSPCVCMSVCIWLNC